MYFRNKLFSHKIQSLLSLSMTQWIFRLIGQHFLGMSGRWFMPLCFLNWWSLLYRSTNSIKVRNNACGQTGFLFFRREIRMKFLVLLFILNVTGKNAGELSPTLFPTTTAPMYTQVKPDETRKFAAPRSTTTAPHSRTMVRTPRTEETTTRTTITSSRSTTTATTRTTTTVTTTTVTNTTLTTTVPTTQNTTETTDNVTITYTTDLSSTSLLNTISNVIQTTGIV